MGGRRCLPDRGGAATAATIVEYFHPEDLVALGLVLAALAAALRQRWLAAGLLVGLACCSKRVHAPGRGPPRRGRSSRASRLRFGLAAVAVPVALVVPLGVAMGRGVWKAVLGTTATPGGTGTLVGRLNLHGLSLTAVSRATARRHPRGGAARPATPRPTSRRTRPDVGVDRDRLALRMLFEVNVFGYYFMALAVVLITIDIVSGRLRIETIGWVVAVAGFFRPPSSSSSW